jgi:hypothetical protein
MADQLDADKEIKEQTEVMDETDVMDATVTPVMPVETVAEAPVETVAEAPVETVAEAPVETVTPEAPEIEGSAEQQAEVRSEAQRPARQQEEAQPEAQPAPRHRRVEEADFNAGREPLVAGEPKAPVAEAPVAEAPVAEAPVPDAQPEEPVAEETEELLKSHIELLKEELRKSEEASREATEELEAAQRGKDIAVEELNDVIEKQVQDVNPLLATEAAIEDNARRLAKQQAAADAWQAEKNAIESAAAAAIEQAAELIERGVLPLGSELLEQLHISREAMRKAIQELDDAQQVKDRAIEELYDVIDNQTGALDPILVAAVLRKKELESKLKETSARVEELTEELRESKEADKKATEEHLTAEKDKDIAVETLEELIKQQGFVPSSANLSNIDIMAANVVFRTKYLDKVRTRRDDAQAILKKAIDTYETCKTDTLDKLTVYNRVVSAREGGGGGGAYAHGGGAQARI